MWVCAREIFLENQCTALVLPPRSRMFLHTQVENRLLCVGPRRWGWAPSAASRCGRRLSGGRLGNPAAEREVFDRLELIDAGRLRWRVGSRGSRRVPAARPVAGEAVPMDARHRTAKPGPAHPFIWCAGRTRRTERRVSCPPDY